MKRIWNTFCEDISKNKGVKEMTFEKETNCHIRKKWMWKMSSSLLAVAIATIAIRRISLCVPSQKLIALPLNMKH